MTNENETIPFDELEAAPPDPLDTPADTPPDPDALPVELESYVDDSDPQVAAKWRIKSLADADWALRRAGELQAEMDENNRILEEAIARLTLRNDNLNARIARGVSFFEWHLKRWAETNRAVLLKGGARKSRKFLHGSIGWRAKGGGFFVVDEAELLGWAQQQDPLLGFVRITEKPAIDAIKEHAKRTGECPPGMDVREPDDVFEVKPHALTVTAKEESDAA